MVSNAIMNKKNKLIKVLYMDLHGDKIYGAENSLYELVTHIASANIDPYVICPEEGVFVDKLKAANIPVLIVPMPKLFGPKEDLRNIFRFIKVCIYSIKAGFNIVCIIKKYNIDILHVNNSNNINILIPRLFGNVFVVWHLRDIIDAPRLWPRFIKLMISRLSHKLIAISNSVAQPFRKCFRGEIDVIANAVSIEKFNTKYNDNRPNHRDIILGSVATICPEKGIEEIIHAAGEIKKIHSNIKVYLYGYASDGQYLNKITSLIENENLNEIIKICDFRNDIETAIKELDIFVLASWAEPLGRSAMEAMQCGKPVVASNAGGLAEIIINRKNGLLFEPRNYRDLANKILALIDDKKLSDELGCNAAVYAKEHFAIDRHVQKISNIYRELMKCKS